MYFDLDYFSWTIYTFDCEKEKFKEKNLEKLRNNIYNLLNIIKKISKIDHDDKYLKKINRFKRSQIYAKTFKFQKQFSNYDDLYLTRGKKNTSIITIHSNIGFSLPYANSFGFFLTTRLVQEPKNASTEITPMN